MFLGPKPKLADFLVKCLLHYITLFYKNLDPKSHSCWHKDPKTEKNQFLLSRLESMVIGQKIKKKNLHFFTFHDPLDSEKPKRKQFFCHFIVRVSRPKSLNISKSPNVRALILVAKHFYINGALMLLKLFQNWWGVLELSPFFTFLKF